MSMVSRFRQYSTGLIALAVCCGIGLSIWLSYLVGQADKDVANQALEVQRQALLTNVQHRLSQMERFAILSVWSAQDASVAGMQRTTKLFADTQPGFPELTSVAVFRMQTLHILEGSGKGASVPPSTLVGWDAALPAVMQSGKPALLPVAREGIWSSADYALIVPVKSPLGGSDQIAVLALRLGSAFAQAALPLTGLTHLRVDNAEGDGRRIFDRWSTGLRVAVSRVEIAQASFRISQPYPEVRGWSRENLVLVGGLALTALGAAFVVTILVLQTRAERESMQMSSSLADSERRLRMVLNTSKRGIWEWRSGAGLYLSSGAAQLLGIEAECDAVYPIRRVLRCFAMQERQRILQGLRSYLANLDDAFDLEVESQMSPGIEFSLRIMGEAQWSPDGVLLSLIGSVTDVSSRVAQRKALEATRSFLSRVLEMIPQPVFIKGEDRNLLMANAACESIYGIPSSKILGKRVADFLIFPEEARAFEQDDASVLETPGKMIEREIQFTDQDGTVRTIISRKVAVVNSEGRPVIVGAYSDVTRLRGIEASLRASMRTIDALIENAPVGIALLSSSREMLRINPAFCRMLQRKEETLIGEKVQGFTPPEYLAQDDAQHQQLMRKGQCGSIEKEYWLPDGSRLPVRVAAQVLVEDSDGTQYIWAIVEDYSERKQAEEALKRAYATNRSIIQALPDMLFQVDEENRFILYHAPSRELLSIPPSEFLGRTLEEVVSPAASERFKKAIGLARHGFGTQILEYVSEDGLGRPQDFEARISPISSGGTLIIIRCVTEQRQTLRHLEESEQRFRLMSDSAPIVIWLFDDSVACTYVNRMWLELTGRTAEEELGHGWLERLSLEDRDNMVTMMTEAVMELQSFEAEFRIRAGDGSVRWMLGRGVPRFDSRGEFFGYLVCCVDVTERILVEEELERHRDHLSELVQEQTADLVRARDDAQAANEAKSTFLANMSHELRTPMHAILSYANIGEKKAGSVTSDKVIEYFQRVKVSGERLLALLNDLLDLSKLEAGKMVMEIRPYNIRELMQEALHEFDVLFTARKQKIYLKVADNLPKVRLDPTRIGQVMRNLLSNASKFTPEGRSVTVTLTREMFSSPLCPEEQHDAIRISVADEGVGIPEDELEAVFDKFVQSSKTRTKAGGTGLGLAICKEIVDAHAGILFARNNPVAGAEFVLYLPITPENLLKTFL